MAGGCSFGLQEDAFLSGREFDPMRREVDLSLPQTGDGIGIGSPTYVPVSTDWHGTPVADVAGQPGGLPLERLFGPNSPRSPAYNSVWDLGGSQECNNGPAAEQQAAPAQSTTTQGQEPNIEALASQVDDLVVVDKGQAGPEGAQQHSVAAIVAEAAKSFIRQVFVSKDDTGLTSTPAPVRAVAANTGQSGRTKATAKTRRATSRLAKKPSAVPVALRATHRLIKELDIGTGDGPVTQEALAQYLQKFGKALTAKDLAALSKVTRLDNAQLILAMEALAQEEEAADEAAA